MCQTLNDDPYLAGLSDLTSDLWDYPLDDRHHRSGPRPRTLRTSLT